MNVRRIRLPLLAAVAILALAAGSHFAAAGKPAPLPPPPPAVLYQARFFDPPAGGGSLSVFDANNQGQAVGEYWFDPDGTGTNILRRAFLYDPSRNIDTAVDLTSLTNCISSTGCAIRSARAINASGDIAAYIEPVSTPGENLQAAMIDMQTVPPTLRVIPDRGFTSDSHTHDLNDWGDVVVHYRNADGSYGGYIYNFGTSDPLLKTLEPLDLGLNLGPYNVIINNSRQVAGVLANGVPFRALAGDAPQTFASLGLDSGNEHPSSMNSFGEFCGSLEFNLNKSGSRTEPRPYLMGTSLKVSNSRGYGLDLNEARDVLGYDSATDTIQLHRPTGDLVIPTDLLDPDDVNTAWYHEFVFRMVPGAISDRDAATAFPCLYGHVDLFGSAGYLGCVLIPVPVPQ